MIKIWEKFMLDHQGEDFPMIIPIVFYHGDTKWQSKTNIFNLLRTQDESFRSYMPDFKYILFDLDTTGADLLEFTPQLRYTLAVMRDRDKIEQLEIWLNTFLLNFSDDVVEMSAFYYYFLCGTKLPDKKTNELFEEKNMGLEKYKLEDFEEGTGIWQLLKRERDSAIEKGIEKNRIEVAINLLAVMSDEDITRVVKLPLEQIKQLRQEHQNI